jgi:hypothetical protein
LDDPKELAQWIDPIKPLLEKGGLPLMLRGFPAQRYNFVRERVKAYSK